MSAFFELLSQSAAYRAMLRHLEAGETPMGLLGLSGAQKAHWIAALGRQSGRPTLALCADEGAATRLCEDLQAFGVRAAVYPAREFHYHSADSCSRDYEQQRIGVLFALCRGELDAVACSPEAACQFTLPQQELRRRSLLLQEGADCALNETAQILLAAGYQRAEQVEGTGQFSVRGGILDLFPPGSAKPVRVEYWGDTIDSISAFDPETQRRTERLKELEVTPATEILFDGSEDLCRKLEAFLPTVKGKGSVKARQVLEHDLEQLRTGVRLPCVDRYLRLAYESPQTLFDYMDGALLFVCESAGVKQKMQGAQTLLLEDIKLMLAEGCLTKELASFSLSWQALLNEYERFGAVFCDHLARGSFDLPVRALESVNALPGFGWDGTLRSLTEDIGPMRKLNGTVVVAAGTEKAARELAYDLETEGFAAHYFPVIPAAFTRGTISVIAGSFSGGFSYPELQFSLITLQKAGTVSAAKKARRRIRQGKAVASLEELVRGDYVVHAVHGIGIFDGIKTMTVDGSIKDFIKINYRGADVLYLPVTQLDLVAKYVSPKDGDHAVKLNRLGSDEWKKTKQRVRASVKEMAAELIKLYAARLHAKGFAFSPDIDMQSDFERRFIFDETEDQLAAVNEIKRDMERACPMDRLLCGDVGFGKTEVALRAAFKCIADGKQCAILVPTTILAFQHYQTIRQRFDGFPIEVEMLSRFRTPAERTRIKKDLQRGAVDLIVGTHAILAKNIEFRDLGLLIVDEEQRFGVAQKEKLKARFPNVDVLTLSATPIPRTLGMAMSGIRDMSVLEMPPADRHPVQTYVLPHDDDVLAEAIERELRRGGQVYYLHNRVESIERTAAKLHQRLPQARIGIAHGKMSEEDLSEIWRQLLDGELDLLVCTTIIETGVDVPNANTLIIENAERLGLAQLHQIRGRVGRSARRAFAYFTYHPQRQLSEEAERRLSAIREYTEFGAGFRIAMRDLEIRGAGNILGAQQHGHMEAVGYDMYLQLLSQAVQEEKDETPAAAQEEECLIDIAVDAHIPETYIETVRHRIAMYKRIASIRTKDDAMDVLDECIDRFGDVPQSVQGLIDVALIRNRAAALGIREISQRAGMLLLFSEQVEPQYIAALASAMRSRVMVSAAKGRPYLSVRLLDQAPTDVLQKVLDCMEHAKDTN